MDLATWSWKNRTTLKKISEDTGISTVVLSQIKRRKHVPGLLIALKLCDYTDGEVHLEEMMPESAEDDFIQWREKVLG